MIETSALTTLENLYRQWHIDTSDFLGNSNYVLSREIWEIFPEQLYFPNTDNSHIEKEIKDNLLAFNRDGLEFVYLQRIDSLYGGGLTAFK